MNKKTALQLALCALLAYGCGSGSSSGGAKAGGAGGGANGGAADTKTAALLFGPGIQLSDGKPSSIPQRLVGGDIHQIKPLYTGAFDASSGLIKSLKPNFVIYAKTGFWWRIATDVKNPTPTQISSETTADVVCHANLYTDYQNALNSRLVYELPGADNTCATTLDNQWRATKIGAPNTDSPVLAHVVLSPIADKSTGAITGWYTATFTNVTFGTLKTRVPSAIVKLDADFDSAQTLLTIDTSNPLAALASDVSYLGEYQDKAVIQSGNKIFVGGGSGQLTARYTSADIIEFAAIFDGQLYVIESGDKRLLQSINLADGTATPLSELGENFAWMKNGGNYLITSYTQADGLLTLIATHKTTKKSTTLATNIKHVDAVTPKYIYFTASNKSGQLEAAALSNDGTEIARYANAEWVGTVYPDSIPLTGEIYPSQLLRADIIHDGEHARPKLIWSYDAILQAPIATLGTIDDGAESVFFFGIGDNVLGAATFGGKRDIYLAKPASANSLLRLTNSADIDESLFGF